MDHILATIDFGSASSAVADYAALIAQRTGARLTLLHVYERLAEESVHPLTHTSLRNAETRLALRAQALRQRYGNGLAIETVVPEAEPSSGILDYGGEVDLTVIGQTERHGLWRFLLGDVTGRVIDGAHGSVLVVPAGHPARAPRDIVFAADERLPDAEAFAPLRELAGVMDARIEIYHAHPAHAAAHTQDGEVDRLFAGLRWNYTLGTPVGDLRHFLIAHAGSSADGWLCLTHRRRAPLAQSLLRSLSERVAAVAPMPVLLLVEHRTPKGQPQPRLSRAQRG